MDPVSERVSSTGEGDVWGEESSQDLLTCPAAAFSAEVVCEAGFQLSIICHRGRSAGPFPLHRGSLEVKGLWLSTVLPPSSRTHVFAAA